MVLRGEITKEFCQILPKIYTQNLKYPFYPLEVKNFYLLEVKNSTHPITFYNALEPPPYSLSYALCPLQRRARLR